MQFILSILNRVLITLGMLLIYSIVCSQQIPEREADSLRSALVKSGQGAERLNLVLRIAQYHLSKNVVTTADIDSASVFIKQATLLNSGKKNIKGADGYIALLESCLHRKKQQRDIGEQKADNAIKILTGGTNNSLLGQAYFEKANYYDYDYKDQTIRKRIYFIELAISATKQSLDILRLAYYYRLLGDLHHLISENSQAIDDANLSLKYYQSIRSEDLQAVYSLLGKLYYAQGDYELALSDELKAMQIAEHNRDTSRQLCEIQNNLGFIYYKLNDGENALKYFSKSLEIAKRENDNRNIYMVASNVAESYLKLKRPVDAKRFLEDINNKYPKPTDKIYEAGDYANNKVYLRLYVALREFDKAKFYCDQLIKETKNPHINSAILSAYYAEIIQYYIATSQYALSLIYLNKNKELLDSTKDLIRMARNYNLWFTLDTSESNYKSAVAHLIEANRINDSIFTETQSRQIQRLGVEYQTAKKEDSLKQKDQYISLLLQTNNLQHSNLRQANLIRNITIAGTGLILVALILLYFQLRKNKRNSRIISQKNEELKDMLVEKEWWLKEVHHRVKNNLHTIICLLESQAMYLDKDALQAIEKSQHRIYAMSLIHQKLYQNEDLQVIDMSVYLEEFIGYLKDSFDVQKIDFTLNVEPVHLNLQQAIPVALIINEAVTNSIKYAFLHEQHPTILISMSTRNEIVNLTIADNGSGFEMNAGDEVKSLGVQLIKGLSKELKGKVRFETEAGTSLLVEFKKDLVSDQMTFTNRDYISNEI